MLIVDIAETEYYDRVKEEFVEVKAVQLKLEHSLVAISKWEAKWEKPFIGNADKTDEELYDYIECMVLNEEPINPLTFRFISKSNIELINSYIKAPMTATTIKATKGKNSRRIITSELIYYWMISFSIPFECQHWHLNRLMMLINVCDAQNTPAKKQSPKDALAERRRLNEARKAAMKSSG